MDLLWQTAISMLDMGTNLVFNMLGRQLNAQDLDLIHALFHAIDNPSNTTTMDQRLRALTHILAKGKDILLVTNEDNYNLLQVSIIRQRVDIAKMLLEHGADPNRGTNLLDHCCYITRTQLTNSHSFNTVHTALDSGSDSESFASGNSDSDSDSENETPASLTSSHFTADQMQCTCHLATTELITEYDTPLLIACCVYNWKNIDNIPQAPSALKKRTDSDGDDESSGEADDTLNDSNHYLMIDDELYFEKYNYEFISETSSKRKPHRKYSSSSESNAVNTYRMKLVDVMLQKGADQYKKSVLSAHSLKLLNALSKKQLKKWLSLASEADASLSPLHACICFDDARLFATLYEHNERISSYLKKRDEYQRLLYLAVKSESINCLVYLINSRLDEFTASNTLFFMLENSRCTQIIHLLINTFRFNLTRVDAHSNTALHYLFSANSLANLHEYKEKNYLRNILFILINKAGVRNIVNNRNARNELCVQSLFQADTLIDCVFFHERYSANSRAHTHKWQLEFRECVAVLRRSGANMCSLATGSYENALECLLQRLSERSNRNRIFYANYLHEIVREILTGVDRGKIRKETNFVTKYMELLLVVNLNEFESSLETLKLLCQFEKPIRIGTNLLTKFLTAWIQVPNFFELATDRQVALCERGA